LNLSNSSSFVIAAWASFMGIDLLAALGVRASPDGATLRARRPTTCGGVG
jgi:hypothetical protein